MFFVLGPMAITACSDEDDSEAGDFIISASIDPDPPIVGRHTMTLSVTDLSSTPVLEASIEVDPQMPAHGHGSNETPLVTEIGEGTYEAYPVTFTMPGTWEVTVHATAGEKHGMQHFNYEAQ